MAPDLGVLVASSVCLGLCGRLAREAQRSQHAQELVRAVGGRGVCWKSSVRLRTISFFLLYTHVDFVRVSTCLLRRGGVRGGRHRVSPPGAVGRPEQGLLCASRPGPSRTPSRGDSWGPKSRLCLQKLSPGSFQAKGSRESSLQGGTCWLSGRHSAGWGPLRLPLTPAQRARLAPHFERGEQEPELKVLFQALVGLGSTLLPALGAPSPSGPSPPSPPPAGLWAPPARAASGFLVSGARASRNSAAVKGLDSILKCGVGQAGASHCTLPSALTAQCRPGGWTLVCPMTGTGHLVSVSSVANESLADPGWLAWTSSERSGVPCMRASTERGARSRDATHGQRTCDA